MRKQIEELARGKFGQGRPVPEFSADKIELEILEGQEVSGTFTIKSLNHIPMRGVVYTSDTRMECLTPQFEGTEVTIRYQFHGAGLTEGDVVCGEFYVVAEGGEHHLAYEADVTKLYADSSIGKIKSLADFTRLAKENFTEACKVFSSKSFRNVLKKEQVRERLLYEGFAEPPFLPQNVEEFLVGTGKKSSVLISLDTKYQEYYGITEDIRGKIELKKDQWGYVELDVDSDADFLVPEKRKVTTADFIGSRCQVYYRIRADKLHAGRNFARVTLKNTSQVQCVEFCVSSGEREKHISRERMELASSRVKLAELYIDYRLKRIVTGVWASESVRLLQHMQALEPDHAWFSLMRAQALLINRQKQEALWILEAYKKEAEDTESPQYGYYLYLCTLAEREPSYVRKNTQRIQEIFRENPDNDILFWVLLFLKEEYLDDPAKKLAVIKERIGQGTASPYLYLEALYLYQHDPGLVTSLEGTELKILRWAAAKKALNRELAVTIMNLAANRRVFDKKIYELLSEAYRYFDGKEMLSVICSYLIKGQCFAPDYVAWYARAIREELHITNLNEAYMMSLDKRSIVRIPRQVLLYFQYDSSISDEQKAVLYVNIIANREKEPGLYENYRRQMERFAMQQIKKGRINDNLSVIYEEMLDEGMLTKELSESLARILYMNKLVCFSPDITGALVIEPQLRQKIRVAFQGNSAYVPLFSGEYAILLEDRNGRRYTSLSYQLEKLMRPGRYLRKCMRYAPDRIEYALGYLAGKENFYAVDGEDGALFSVLMDSDAVDKRYKAKLMPRVLEYYVIHDMEEELERYLKKADVSWLDKNARKYVFSLLMERKLFEEAYDLLISCGSELADPSKLVVLCSHMIETGDHEEDEVLVGLGMEALRAGKYNDVLLRYLCRYYHGPTRQMYELWETAKKYEIEDPELEEWILVQMLYTTEFVEHASDLFRQYAKNGGDRTVLLAYFNYFAQHYFVDDMVIDPEIFLELQEKLLEKEPLTDACRLAVLKHLAFERKLQEQEEKLVDALLGEYTARDMYFSFYERFDRKLQQKYFFQGQTFLEYHTDAQAEVILHYAVGEEEFKEEEMKEVYAGIYVSRFMLFFGDSLQYYIEERNGEQTRITESAQITRQDVYGEQEKDSYEFLNAMLMNLTLQNYEELERLALAYEKKKEFTEKNFRVITGQRGEGR